MPTYVSLIRWTDQGIKNYKDSPSRAADFTKSSFRGLRPAEVGPRPPQTGSRLPELGCDGGALSLSSR